MSTVESIARPRRNGERRRAPTASISKESPAITGVVEMVIRRPILEPPSGDLQERVLIRHHDYDQCFQSVQLLQWNSQVKFNVTVYRNLPTTRDSIMTS